MKTGADRLARSNWAVPCPAQFRTSFQVFWTESVSEMAII